MKFRIAFLFSLSLIFTSCWIDSNSNRSTRENNPVATPEVLDESKSYKLDYISRGRDRDLVLQLYREAMSKDESLEMLDAKIRGMREIKNKSLQPLHTYKQTNDRYWKSALNGIRGIKDSLLRKSTFDLFQKLEGDYKSSLTNLEAKEKQIQALEKSLQDQVSLLKVVITQPMMSNYQKNEKPDIENLEKLVLEYSNLIAEIKEYTE